MSENRGIFSLEEFYDLQVSGAITDIFDPFRYVEQIVTLNPYAYAANGSNRGIDRIDFNNDTATAVEKLSTPQIKKYASNFGNLSYGYITGGYGPGNNANSVISRIDYSNDGITAATRGPLSTAIYFHAGVGNMDYGYSVCGQEFPGNTSSNRYTFTQRTDYSNDTGTASPKGNFPVALWDGGTSGTGTMDYGWIGNGSLNYGSYSTINRIDYSNDTAAATPRGPLSTFGKSGRKATGNSTHGYWQGGYTQTKFNRIDFSNDTATGVDKGTSSVRAYKNGAVTSKDYGYVYGEYYPYNSTVERIDYSNDDTAAVTKGSLSNTGGGGNHMAGCSAQQFGLPTSPIPATVTESWTVPVGNDAGYFTNGTANPPHYSVVDRIDFNNDTAIAATKSPTLVPTRGSASVNNTAFGYTVAGSIEGVPAYTTTNTSTVSRLSFAGDIVTQVSVANYPVEVGGVTGATGNTDFGYISGGYTPAPASLSSVYRMDYSSDSIAASSKGPLTFIVQRNAAAGNQSFGWFAGGAGTPTGQVSTVQRIDYGNDTATATVKGSLNLVNSSLGATGNASYGYFGGGYFTSRVDRIDYANDTPQTSPKGPLLYSYITAATGNSSYGYWTQGHPFRTSIGRLDYASDTTTASPKGNLSLARFDTGALSSRINGFPTTVASTPVDKGAAGYTVAGSLGPAYGYWIAGGGGGSQYNRVDFSNDTGTAGVRGNLDRSIGKATTVSSMNYSYTVGGFTSTHISRIDYADDTATATPKGNLPPINGNSSAAGVDNINYGYICGGLPLTTVNRIDFSNDTAVASTKGPLTATRRYISATGNSSYGYVIAGTPPTRSNTDRIDYSNDSVTATVKGNLPYVIQSNGATGNADYGYVTGGFNTAPGSNNWISSVSRIDYANDTATAAPKGPLTQRRRTKSTGNTSYGWSGGGSTDGHAGTSTMDRIDYANDTATASARGPLSGTRTNQYAAGAQANAKQGSPTIIPRIRWVDNAIEAPAVSAGPAYGYWGGGYHPSTVSTVSRLDFSSDSTATTPKGNLSAARHTLAATGNSTHGYFGGGTPSSIVDRIDYGNDTATASPKGPLSLARGQFAATGNSNFGYFAGGTPGGPYSTVDRIDYSNDSATASTKGSLANGIYYQTATGNSNFGYFAGGSTGTPAHTYVQRIDYSNDTDTALMKGNLYTKTRRSQASGNSNFGYVSGGDADNAGAPILTMVQRIDYSNDIATAVQKGDLDYGKFSAGGTGSDSFGYSGGGRIWPAIISLMSRIDYSNDTATATAKGNLTNSIHSMGAVSARENALLNSPTAAVAAPVQPPFPFPVQLPPPAPNPYGYVVGGSGNGSPSGSNNPAQKIDFTNDTATALVKAAPAGDRHYYSSATSNRDFAYSCMAGSRTYIQRLDYSNDSANFLIKGHRYTGFSNASGNYGGYNEAATGNLSYGYWNGGYKNYSSPVDPSVCPNGHIQAYSHIDRIDYSNDTANSLRRSYTTTKRGGGAAAGTNEYGYWIGNGANQCSGSYAGTIVERTDYASDTTNASVRGNLNTSTDGGRAAGNKDYAWLSGRQWHHTNVERIDYANDTATASIKGPLSAGRTYHQATGNQDYGYACGTHDFSLSYKSIVERIDYSNDTATGSPKGPLAYATSFGGGTSATLNNNGGTVSG